MESYQKQVFDEDQGGRRRGVGASRHEPARWGRDDARIVNYDSAKTCEGCKLRVVLRWAWRAVL